MSFKVELGKTKSEKTALDKTVTYDKTFSGTLLNDTNIINPSIRLKVAAEDIALYNYMKITNFSRLYFITDVVALTDKTCVVTGHVDVLATYKTSIRLNQAVIGRSESRYNLFIDDGLFKVDAKTIIQTKKFTGGGKFQTTPGIALVTVG